MDIFYFTKVYSTTTLVVTLLYNQELMIKINILSQESFRDKIVAFYYYITDPFVPRRDCDHTSITCQGTNVSENKRVWAQSCLGTIVCGYNRVWAQMCGHNQVWAQTCLGTIVCGHNRVWAQSCVGTIVRAQSCGLNHVWAQSWWNRLLDSYSFKTHLCRIN